MQCSNRFVLRVDNMLVWFLAFWFLGGAEAFAAKDKEVTINNTASNPVPVIIQSGAGSLSKTLVEILRFNLNSTNTAVYTVPTAHRLVITDVIVNHNFTQGRTCFLAAAHLYRNGSEASLIYPPCGYQSGGYRQGYQSGIQFLEGQVVAIGNDPMPYGLDWELRGYLEPLSP